MSTAPTPRRHALGMPAGSVRALLGLSVLGLLWALALTHPDRLPPAFVYLMFLMVVILVHYFAAHGKNLGKQATGRSALGLPRGSVRLLLMGGFIGLLALLWKNSTKVELPEGDKLFQLIGLLLLGFFVGYVLTGLFRAPDGQLPAWFQDVQAWLALLATVGLCVLILVYAVINPTLAAEQQMDVDRIEAACAALIGFYFGARS